MIEPSEELRAEVDQAQALTERRHAVEQMQQVNDAALQRLAAVHRIGIGPADVIALRFSVLVEQLFGDMDDVRRIDYERAVQVKFAEVIAGAEAQAARATLLNGVRLDPRANGGRG